MHQAPVHYDLRPTRLRRSAQHVGFADTVELLIGEEQSLHLCALQVPETLLGSGQLPWHLNPPRTSFWCDPLVPNVSISEDVPSLAFRFPQQSSASDLLREQEHVPDGEHPEGDKDAVEPDHLPVFARQILAGDRLAIDDDWTQGMTVRTWFRRHGDLLHCEVPRLLQLVGVATSWKSQLLARWTDFVRFGEPTIIHLANPDPPRPGDLNMVMYDILIVQGADPHRGAGIVTAMTTQEPFQYFAAAALLPVHVNGLQLVDVVHLVPTCQTH